MSRIIRATALALLLVAFAASILVADTQDDSKKVTVTATAVGDSIQLSSRQVTIPLRAGCDSVTIVNSYSGPVHIWNDLTPSSLPSKTDPDPGDLLAAGDTTKYGFCCGDEAGAWRFLVKKSTGANFTDTLTVFLVCNPVPSLNTYGFLILALILAATSVWLIFRRRANASV
jgi:hypothetical protein